MSNPISSLVVTPGYDAGFSFTWQVAGGLEDPGPWRFTVEESATTADNWKTISPVLVDTYAWADTVRRIPDKDAVLYFRIVLQTGCTVYSSDPVAPWGQLTRREYLLVKDIMRREVLHASTLAGTTGNIYIKNVYGPRCPVCIDPITGVIRNSKCPSCMGTGYAPPYHGPYTMWLTFTPNNGKIEFTDDGSGTYQERDFTIRAIGCLPLRKGDAIIDPTQDKRYIILNTKNEAELRRVPIVQSIAVSEAPTTDAIYKLK